MYGKIKLIICVFLIVFFSIQLNGQEKKLVGKIIDKKTKEPIPGTYVNMNSIPVTFSDENGVFELSGQQIERADVTFTHLAYEPKTVSTKRLKDDTTSIEMSEKLFGLGEIIVVQENTKSLVKKIHKHFEDSYRPYCYWTQSHYQQKILLRGLIKGYLEIAGYTFMPIPESHVWRGAPHTVPIELRRTREDNIISKLFYKRHCIFHQAGSTFLDKGEFAFFERIHPLGKFNFNDYEFRLDTTETSPDNQYVLNYKQNKKSFSVVGWPIFGSVGKIWIDRNALDILKINSEFNQGNNEFIRIEVDYLNIDRFIYPKAIKTSTVFNKSNGSKLQEKVLVVSELTFLHIDTEKRPNYQLPGKHYAEYLLPTIVPDYSYHPLYWKKNFPFIGEWKNIVDQLSNGNYDEEFSLGAKEEIFIKGGWGYEEYTGSLKESSLKFVEQMKTDLKLK
jgi:hypothetical protein